MENKKINIVLKNWDYHCADGCCTDYGTIVILDGEEVEHYDPEQHNNSYIGDNVEVALRSVLKHLGYDVEVSEEYE